MSDIGLPCFSELYAGLPLLAMAAVASGVGLALRLVRWLPGMIRKPHGLETPTTR